MQKINPYIDLSIIIVNYNTFDFLTHCLDTIENSKGRFKKEIIIVDNASSDKSTQMINKWLSENQKLKKLPIKLIANQKNLGFAKACNQAIKIAKGKYILFLNPDTSIEEDTLTEMLKFMDKDPNIAVSTCKVELPNEEIDWASHRGFPTPWASFTYFTRLNKLFPKSKVFGGYHLEYKNLNKPHEIDSPCGAFYLVRKVILNKVGSFDEDYFMYAEDLDLSYRIKKAGFKIFYNPKAKIIHHKGAASGMHKIKSNTEKKVQIKVVRSFYDTMKIFYQKHYDTKYPKFVKFLVFLGIDFLRIRRLAKSGLS